MAVNGSVLPTATLPGFGVTLMLCSVGGAAAVTLRLAVPLIPESVAVMVIGPPAAIPFATPVLLTIVAIDVLEEDHTELLVTFWVEPSEKCPVAVNGSVLPTATLPGFGVTVMD